MRSHPNYTEFFVVLVVDVVNIVVLVLTFVAGIIGFSYGNQSLIDTS